MAHSLSQKRLIQNEALQREENDRANRTLRAILTSDDKILFVCECSDLSCRDLIALNNREFMEFHRNPREFVVMPHHETVAIERVIRKTDDYYIVEKNIDPADLSVYKTQIAPRHVRGAV